MRVMMVTGDHATTAVAIARQVGIVRNKDLHFVKKDTIDALVNENPLATVKASTVYQEKAKVAAATPQRSLVVTGVDMGSFNQIHWDWVLAHDEIVFARTTPEDKLKIVTELQKRDHVVGVTGDGVNDAPALRQAEAGVAMGAGSEVAKEAAGTLSITDDVILCGILSSDADFRTQMLF